MTEKQKLDNFRKATKDIITQPLEGLLYDLNLMPEQLKTKIDGLRYSAIVNLHKYYEELLKINELVEKDLGEYKGVNKE